MKQEKDNVVESPPMAVYKPMLYSTPMVIANLERRKTVTRRLVKIPEGNEFVRFFMAWGPNSANEKTVACVETFGKEGTKVLESRIHVGDLLWVRESLWSLGRYEMGTLDGQQDVKSWVQDEFRYLADSDEKPPRRGHIRNEWRKMPSIHMPKEACRMFKEVTDVRISRLQDITPEQAIAEGIKSMDFINEDTGDVETLYWHYIKKKWGPDPVHSFQTLWESINGPGSWESNPYVFEIHYKHLEGHQNPWRSNQ
jgi:hypothetical protein